MNAVLRFALAAALLVLPAAAVTLTRGNGAEPDTLDPHRYALDLETRIMSDLFEGLVMDDARGETAPGIAERWDISDDGTVYTFHLHAGLVWSDGVALTADDVVAGFRRGFDPKTAGSLVDNGFMIKNAKAVAHGEMAVAQLGVRALDPVTVEITLEQPNATFLMLLTTFPVSYPLPRHLYDKVGDDWAKAGVMVSNGPYTLAEWTPQERVRLIKNPRFREASSVAIDEVIYLPTVDPSAALKQFRAGELDLSSDFPEAQYAWLKANMPAETRVDPSASTSFLAINTSVAPFGDARVRRALSLAIDRETLTQKILATGQTAAYGLFPLITKGWVPSPQNDFSATPPAAREAEAKRLLAAAGYGPDNPLVFTLDYRGSETNKRVAVAIAAMLGRIGVKADLQANEVKTHYAKLREGDYVVADGGWQGSPDPEFFASLLRTGSEFNYGRWSNADYDRLTAEAVGTRDPAARFALYAEAERIAMAEAAMIPLYYNSNRALVHDWVKGYEGNASNAHPTRYLRIER
ncbi:putative deoxycholate-binding periplasmic protein YgiS [Alphaproteobacteria bacterium SO-S41]|nr:putative deoxycholate-binding periplasmic protein YgiS [Alphaproteobacteria bacterium SO-S41]